MLDHTFPYAMGEKYDPTQTPPYEPDDTVIGHKVFQRMVEDAMKYRELLQQQADAEQRKISILSDLSTVYRKMFTFWGH